jgi:hypothetical protein
MSTSSLDPIISPIPLNYEKIDDLDKLRARIQSAVQLELTTIPAYLFALYSIIDKASDAYQALRSVVTEEMFHLNQAANLLVAVGGKPKLTGPAAPKYPAYLPSASRTVSPYVGLYRASLPVFQNVFMAIEMPAPYDAPAEGKAYKTIGQFYKAIEDGLERCVKKFGAEKVFHQAEGTRQRSDIYLGKFGGEAISIKDLPTAKFAIRQIVEQGEGAVDPTHPLVPEEPFGTYDYYGLRIDGTYGPILGTPFELSHYFKFKRIVDSKKFPDTYPIISNLRVEDIKNEASKKLAVTFNKYYSIILKSMELSFLVAANKHDVFFEVALPLMHNHLPQLAQQLMTSLVTDTGDTSVGPNAAPTFEYDSDAKLADIVAALDDMGTDVDATHENEFLAFQKTRDLVQTLSNTPAAREPAIPRRPPPEDDVANRRVRVFGGLAENLRRIQDVSEQAGLGL